jgi:hypothetical protein
MAGFTFSVTVSKTKIEKLKVTGLKIEIVLTAKNEGMGLSH